MSSDREVKIVSGTNGSDGGAMMDTSATSVTYWIGDADEEQSGFEVILSSDEDVERGQFHVSRLLRPSSILNEVNKE